MIDLNELTTTQKTYAAHNRIHAEYVDARHGQRRKAQIQEDHEAVVRHVLDLGGRHIPKGDLLDDTLPQDLKEAVKLRYFTDFEFNEAEKLNKIQVLRTGTFHHPTYGKFTITEDSLATMVKNFNEVYPKPPTELVVDYDHLSVDNKEIWQGKAAGWFKNLTQEGDALFAFVEWTEEAAEAIKQKLFRFVSPQFTLNYADSETGKKIGPTILSAALTNRPFLGGMQPVVLSKGMSAVLCSEEESMREQGDKLYRAYYAEFGAVDSRNYVVEVYDAFIIVEEGAYLYRLPYTIDEETEEVTFDTANKTKVKLTKTYEEVQLSESKEDDLVGTSGDPEICLAEWDAAYINDFPDSSFAYIKPGGEKEGGKTVPRALRFLPYRDEDGKVDLSHLRNALSRLPQTKLSAEEKAKARKVLIKAAQAAGIGDYSELPGVTEEEFKEVDMEEKKLRKILKIDEDADIEEAVQAVVAKTEEQATQLTELQGQVNVAEKDKTDAETKLSKEEADKAVQAALNAGKITPKMEAWAKDYALKDPESFKAFVETAEKVGPELDEKGAHTNDNIQLTETEEKAAEKLGVDREAVIALKRADQEAE